MTNKSALTAAQFESSIAAIASDMDITRRALERAFDLAGYPCRVEERGIVYLVTPREGDQHVLTIRDLAEHGIEGCVSKVTGEGK